MEQTEELIEGVNEEQAKFIEKIRDTVADDDKFGRTKRSKVKSEDSPPSPSEVLPTEDIIPKISANDKKIERWGQKLKEQIGKLVGQRFDDLRVQLITDPKADRGGIFWRFQWFINGHPHWGEPRRSHVRMPVHAVSAIIKTTRSANLAAKCVVADVEQEAEGIIYGSGFPLSPIHCGDDEEDPYESRIMSVCEAINNDDFGELERLERKTKGKFEGYQNPRLVADNIEEVEKGLKTLDDDEVEQYIQLLIDQINDSRPNLRVRVDRVTTDSHGRRMLYFRWDFKDNAQVPTCRYDRGVPVSLLGGLIFGGQSEMLILKSIYKDIERKAAWYASEADVDEEEFEEVWFPRLIREIEGYDSLTGIVEFIRVHTIPEYQTVGLYKFRKMLDDALHGDGQQLVFEHDEETEKMPQHTETSMAAEVMDRVKYGSNLAIVDESSDLVLDLFHDAAGGAGWADTLLSSEATREVIKGAVAFGLFYSVSRYERSSDETVWTRRLKKTCGLVAENASHNLVSQQLTPLRKYLLALGKLGETIEGEDEEPHQLPEGEGEVTLSSVVEEKMSEEREGVHVE